ncbi:hypothetical protein HFO56_06000 [Rhizobium laguerreae]|uniref:RNA-directed DNA polymerase n=1 Tax=Rhizobium laguerreae TaxID=1076926 RepID=UPI001C91ABCD|nr:RNA-directed DNA polymerase [Rhizobium laguerreae]MBY3151935.1 hypothetical protein [Rhizobium laguerreae]
MENGLWLEATSIQGLEAGWHLTRNELGKGFFYDYLAADAFGNSLNDNLVELRRRLNNETYQPKPLLEVAVPKGALGTRPGSFISIDDRVVLWSIIKKIAPIFDGYLSDDIYSYRLNKDDPDANIFKEGSINEIMHHAYLKGNIIRKYIDPFEAWYELWPEFEEVSKDIRDEGFGFLSVSDISAYFENISLPILRDMLLNKIPTEQKIVNHISSCLENWAVSTHDGFRPHRGIPQGTSISSFLGNIYLIGIDNIFKEFSNKYEIRYIRYMDDVRIFSKDINTARRIVFTLENAVRKFHLNLQSAKTIILSEENGGQISKYIYDSRMDMITKQVEDLSKIKSKEDLKKVVKNCYSIARLEPENDLCEKILPLPQKLDNLTSRASRRLMNLLVECGDRKCGTYLFDYIERNMDFRFTRIFHNYIRKNPKRDSYQHKILSFLNSDENIFSHQEAELIGVLRYFSTLNVDVRRYLSDRIEKDDDNYFYTKVQLCRIAPRLELKSTAIARLYRNIASTLSDEALCYKALVFSRLGFIELDPIIARYETFPNAKISLFGRHLRGMYSSYNYAKRIIDFVADAENPFKLNDYLGLLPYFLFSKEAKTSLYAVDQLSTIARQHPCVEIRMIVGDMLSRAELHALNMEGKI